MKKIVCLDFGLIGGIISACFGGWDAALTTLALFMALDYVTGLLLAGVFKKSPKTKDGALESKAGLKGLIRKGAILAIVLVAHRLDVVMGTAFLKDGTCIAFIANEALSIVENVGLMTGIEIPKKLRGAIEILRKEDEDEDD